MLETQSKRREIGCFFVRLRSGTKKVQKRWRVSYVSVYYVVVKWKRETQCPKVNWKNTDYENVAGYNARERKRGHLKVLNIVISIDAWLPFLSKWFLHPFEINRKLLVGCSVGPMQLNTFKRANTLWSYQLPKLVFLCIGSSIVIGRSLWGLQSSCVNKYPHLYYCWTDHIC